MFVLGLSSFFHNSAAALFKDGVLIAAAEEERFSRIKFDPSFPDNAITYCLEAAGISPRGLDCIAYFELPEERTARLYSGGVDGGPVARDALLEGHHFPGPEDYIRKRLFFDGDFKCYSHHLSHAAYSVYASGYPSAAVLVADSVGTWHTSAVFDYQNNTFNLKDAIEYPDSLGLFYSAITSYLGFAVNSDEYKVMGLAPYGEYCPEIDRALSRMIKLGSDGAFSLNPLFFDFRRQLYSESLTDLLKIEPRLPGEMLTQQHKNLAKCTQLVLQKTMLALARKARRVTSQENLCMGGGVALNCVSNSHIRNEAGFKNVFVPPGSGDAGSAIGAAALASLEYGYEWPENRIRCDLGPSYSSSNISKLLKQQNIKFEVYGEDELPKVVSQLLVDHQIVGWFQGGMEFGPRALGHRSILADPRTSEMRDKLNLAIKKREGFRPFAPVMLSSKVKDFFVDDAADPFMTFITRVKKPESLGAVTHCDGSARLQTLDDTEESRIVRLLEEFERNTGIPCLLNTSFNLSGEPIVCSPLDALLCFRESGMDVLVLENHVIVRNSCSPDLMSSGKDHLQYSRELRPFLSDTYSFG